MILENYVDGPITGVHPPDRKFWQSFGMVPRNVIVEKRLEESVVRRNSYSRELTFLEKQRSLYIDPEQVPFQLNYEIKALRKITLPILNGRIGGLTASRNRLQSK